MFQMFFPDECCQSTYEIDFEAFYRKGYRGIIFDIDNTLVEHGVDATQRAIGLFTRLRGLGFQTCLLSNNREERVKRFNEPIQTEYIFKAGKPSRRNYREACSRMGTTEETTLFVGDQLFTDVWGAKRCGIYNVLVEPIDKREEIQIVLKRYLERVVLYFYRRSQKNDGLGL